MQFGALEGGGMQGRHLRSTVSGVLWPVCFASGHKVVLSVCGAERWWVDMYVFQLRRTALTLRHAASCGTVEHRTVAKDVLSSVGP